MVGFAPLPKVPPPWLMQIPPGDPPIPGPKARPRPRPFHIDPSCVLYMDFIDRLSIVKALDESAYGNHGTITGTEWVANGLYFGGAAAVDVGDKSSLDFGTGDFTLSSWIKTSTKNSVILSKKLNQGNSLGYEIGTRASGRFYLRLGEGAGAAFITTDDGTIVTDNGLHQVLVTSDSGTITRYIDGSADGTADSETLGTLDNAITFYIGRLGGVFFTGTIPEVAIFKGKAFNPIEANNFYLLGKARLGI